MKFKHFLFVISIAGISILGQCRKSDKNIEDPHNHSLLKKTLPEIKAEISGRWVKKYTYLCGIIAPCTHPAPPNSFIDFIPIDTLKRTENGLIFDYGKISIQKENNLNWGYGGTDSVYVFKVQGSPYSYVMQEIKNDTLIINGEGFMYYTR